MDESLGLIFTCGLAERQGLFDGRPGAQGQAVWIRRRQSMAAALHGTNWRTGEGCLPPTLRCRTDAQSLLAKSVIVMPLPYRRERGWVRKPSNPVFDSWPLRPQTLARVIDTRCLGKGRDNQREGCAATGPATRGLEPTFMSYGDSAGY